MKKKSIFEEIIRVYQIPIEEAKELFSTGTVIYIQYESTNLAPECYNTFMLNKHIWDASLNIYKYDLTPEQYGFDNIIAWIYERTNTTPIFYTYHSTELLNIDNN